MFAGILTRTHQEMR